MDAIQSISSGHIPLAASLLADAFYDNPAHVYICPDDKRRHRNLCWLLGTNLKLQPDLSHSFCVMHEQQVRAMGFWTRSTDAELSTWDMVCGGLYQAPFRLGISGVRRLFEVTSATHRHLQLGLGDSDYWYLNNMAVSKEVRGTGLGARLLEQELETLEAGGVFESAALVTQRPENVTFYQRLGFQVVWEDRIGSGANEFVNWTMARSLSV